MLGAEKNAGVGIKRAGHPGQIFLPSGLGQENAAFPLLEPFHGGLPGDITALGILPHGRGGFRFSLFGGWGGAVIPGHEIHRSAHRSATVAGVADNPRPERGKIRRLSGF